jgi:hypothetical protein
MRNAPKPDLRTTRGTTAFSRLLAVGAIAVPLLACGGLSASFEQAKQDAMKSAREAVQRELAEQILEAVFEGSAIEIGEDGDLASFAAEGIDIGMGPNAEVPDGLLLRPPDGATLFAAGSATTEAGRSIDFAVADVPAGTDIDAALAAYQSTLEADGWTIRPLPEDAGPDAPKTVHAERNGERAIAFVVPASEIDAPNAERIALLQVGAAEAPANP